MARSKSKISEPQEPKAPGWIQPMRRFYFTSGTVPEVGGQGVQWADGRVVYTEYNGHTHTQPIAGHMADIRGMYGGNEGYSLTFVDAA